MNRDVCEHFVPTDLHCDHCNHPLYAAVKCRVCGRVTEPVQEPVAWYDPEVMNEDRGISWTPGQFHTAPLYTAPPQRQPLTEEEIMAIGRELGAKCRLGGNSNIDFDYARAIEAAHGIGSKT